MTHDRRQRTPFRAQDGDARNAVAREQQRGCESLIQVGGDGEHLPGVGQRAHGADDLGRAPDAFERLRQCRRDLARKLVGGFRRNGGLRATGLNGERGAVVSGVCRARRRDREQVLERGLEEFEIVPPVLDGRGQLVCDARSELAERGQLVVLDVLCRRAVSGPWLSCGGAWPGAGGRGPARPARRARGRAGWTRALRHRRPRAPSPGAGSSP